MDKFIKREDGIWDAPNCNECCSDCSHPEEECKCPLEVENTCDNCIFNKGYKKCGECCSNARTTKYEYIEMGYGWMCDSCIEKYN